MGQATSSLPGSQHAGLPETVIAPARRVGGGAADDDVVEQLDVDGLGGFAELPRHLHVRGARRRVAAGVIVDTDNRGGAVPDGFAEDLARMGQAAGGGAGGDLDLLEQAVLPVQAEHPEFFYREPDRKST